jgi:hypothetical protein
VQEHPGHHQPGDIGGQDRLAARLGGQPAEREQDNQQQLDLRFGDAVAEPRDRQPEQPGQQQPTPARNVTKPVWLTCWLMPGMFPASAPTTISASAAGTAIQMLTIEASRAMPSQMAAT